MTWTKQTKVEEESSSTNVGGWGLAPWGSSPWGGVVWNKITKDVDTWTKITKEEDS